MQRSKRITASIKETSSIPTGAQGGTVPYQRPPEAIQALVDAATEPLLLLSPGERQRYLAVLERPPLTSIQNFALTELRLAGYRFYPTTYTPSRLEFFRSISIRELDPAKATLWPLRGLATEPLDIGYIKWAPDGTKVAFCTFDRERGLDLWIGEMETRSARCVLRSDIDLASSYGLALTQATEHTRPTLPERLRLHAITADPYAWCGDSQHLLLKLVVYDERQDSVTDTPKAQRWRNTKRPSVPLGPIVQVHEETRGAPARTYPDLLRDEYDMELFELYTTAQLVVMDIHTLSMRCIGEPASIRSASPSPDGRYLLVERTERPYSTTVPASRFPRAVDILCLQRGTRVRTVARIPIQEYVPLAFDATILGPRSFGWRNDDTQVATLVWVETCDQGDPDIAVPVRDIVYSLSAPFSEKEQPRPLICLEKRFAGILWGNNEVAVISERWYKTRSLRLYTFRPGTLFAAGEPISTEHPSKLELLFDVSDWEDVYRDPGDLVSKRTVYGKNVLRLIGPHQRQVLLSGRGASDQGDRPFLDVMDLDTRERWRLWQSAPPYFESFVAVLEASAPETIPEHFVISRETPDSPTNYYLVERIEPVLLPSAVSMDIWTNHFDQVLGSLNATGDHHQEASRWRQLQPLTWFPHPAPSLAHVQRQLVRYNRSTDNLRLSAALYLPPGYEPARDGPLPFFVWAYPREFRSADAAGQLRDSPYRFIRLARTPLYWLTQGFGVLEGPAMPIIGPKGDDANDTFVEQLVASAEAAVEFLVSNGYADRQRIAIGGHSYGAFMTANLLCHAPGLFCCGIARSGAYNRTLTPFGFQNEQRTLWQARDIYMRLSPYLYANQIQTPLLLIHGQDDDNPGTFPLQSERFFQALKGHGKIARLVLLPLESHAYQARESVLHVLAEMDLWLKRWCLQEQSFSTNVSERDAVLAGATEDPSSHQDVFMDKTNMRPQTETECNGHPDHRQLRLDGGEDIDDTALCSVVEADPGAFDRS
jgi:dipeptidyl aminopeptidase/acylaminoacyl peptidase